MKYLMVLVVLTACGSSTDARPSQCDPSERKGTYLTHMSERAGGACGAVPDAVGRLDDYTALTDGCVLDAPDRLTNNGCTFERAFTCEQPADGLVLLCGGD